MTKHLFIIFFTTCAASSVVARDPNKESNDINGMQAIRIKCKTEFDLKIISQFYGKPGFDFLVPPQKNIDIEVFVVGKNAHKFKNTLNVNQIEHKVDIIDVRRKVDSENLQCSRQNNKIIDFEKVMTCPQYNTIRLHLSNLANKYPNKLKLITIGKSFEGRDIISAKITLGRESEEKPAILIDAGIHAREWLTPITAVYAIEAFLNDSDFKDVDVYVIPVLNPDGYVYTFENPNNRLWRKSRSIIPGTQCRGVDLNRNFASHWTSSGRLADPCLDVYSGPKPFSEPESVALRNYIMKNKNIKAYVTLHSYGNKILYPWGYTSEPHTKARGFKCIGELMKKAIRDIYQTEYTVAPVISIYTPDRGLSLAGNSIDWAIEQAHVKLAFGFELPNKNFGFNPPPSRIKMIGEETFEAFKVLAKSVSKKHSEICRIS